MSNREASLQETLNAAFQSQMNNVFTSLPCVVVAVRENLNTQMVDIQPTINQRQKDGVIKERPIILGVPVSFQVSKSSGFTFPIKVGDTGLAVFSMRSLDTWKAGQGLPTTPLNFAKMDKGDAIFIPGIQPPSIAVNNPSKRFWTHNTKDTVVVHNIGTSAETEIRFLEAGGIIINTNQDVEVNCENLIANVNADTTITTDNLTINAASNVDLTASTMSVTVGETTWSGNITHTGNYTMTGIATFNGIIFNTHRHTGVTPGIGTSGGPTN